MRYDLFNYYGYAYWTYEPFMCTLLPAKIGFTTEREYWHILWIDRIRRSLTRIVGNLLVRLHRKTVKSTSPSVPYHHVGGRRK